MKLANFSTSPVTKPSVVCALWWAGCLSAPSRSLWLGEWVGGEEVWVPRSHSHYSQPGLPSGGLWGSAAGLQTVAKVQVNNEGRVQGVTLQDGEEVRSRVVLSCASPQVTFLELTPQVRRVRGEI